MTRTNPDATEKKQLEHPCRCKAKAGQWCVTARREPARKLHSRRGANAFRMEREQATARRKAAEPVQ